LHEFSEIFGKVPKFPKFPNFTQIFPNFPKCPQFFPIFPIFSQIGRNLVFFHLGGRSRITYHASENYFCTCQGTFQSRVTSMVLRFVTNCRFRNFPNLSEISQKFLNCENLSPALLSLPLHRLGLRLAAGTSRTRRAVGNGLQRKRRSLTGRLRRTCHDFYICQSMKNINHTFFV
jgi:hypothetical protein